MNIQNKKQEAFVIQDFIFDINCLDGHIENILRISEASYSQVALASFTTLGFILAHGGLKNTSLYFLDLSNSGTGKSINMDLQCKALLQGIIKMQEELQLNNESENDKRFNNIHRGKITIPVLKQCLQTVESQFAILDEFGMLMAKNDELIDELTKIYGNETASLSVTKLEALGVKNTVPVKFSFMGATTVTYLGGVKELTKHLHGGFLNRPFLAYSTKLKNPEEITSIFNDDLDYEASNAFAMRLFQFAKTFSGKFYFSQESEKVLLEFKQEIQRIKIQYNNSGLEFGVFYARTNQNTHILINILHSLKCYEANLWSDEIDVFTTKCAIDFIKKVVFVEIDKIINYLSGSDLLEREEKQKNKICKFIQEYEATHDRMPKIREVTHKTRLTKSKILELTKNYLEIVPGETILRYCHN